MKKIVILLVYFLGISYLGGIKFIFFYYSISLIVYFFICYSKADAKTLTCADEPCANGKCIEIENSITKWAPYVCECKPEWFGVNCDRSDSSKLNRISLLENFIFYAQINIQVKSDGHFKANAIKLNTDSSKINEF